MKVPGHTGPPPGEHERLGSEEAAASNSVALVSESERNGDEDEHGPALRTCFLSCDVTTSDAEGTPPRDIAISVPVMTK